MIQKLLEIHTNGTSRGSGAENKSVRIPTACRHEKQSSLRMGQLGDYGQPLGTNGTLSVSRDGDLRCTTFSTQRKSSFESRTRPNKLRVSGQRETARQVYYHNCSYCARARTILQVIYATTKPSKATGNVFRRSQRRHGRDQVQTCLYPIGPETFSFRTARQTTMSSYPQ